MSNKRLDQLWAQAAAQPGTPIDIGDLVVCDLCDADWTDARECGGFIFQSKAVCPDCARKYMAAIIVHGEQAYIRARCPEDMAFADFIRASRAFNNAISIGPRVKP